MTSTNGESDGHVVAGNNRRVAVIGGGVAGLAAAWHLKVNTSNEVHLFEAEDRLGGHACTVEADGVEVDIGFMVFNHSNYPNMVEWFKSMGVKEEDSDMSLAVSLDQGKTVEWSSDGLNALFANRKQVLSPSFYKFLSEMIRFNETAADILQLPDEDPRKLVTTGQYLRDHNYSLSFSTYYLLPMMAALWSASLEDVMQFPAAQLIGFLCNHQMLRIFGRPAWKTVAGRSQQYTKKLHKEILGEKSVHVSSPISSIEQQADGTYKVVKGENGSSFSDFGVFHDVVFACHPPTTLRILKNSLSKQEGKNSAVTPELLDLLGHIEYADNVIYVHSDPALMPSQERAWASWNCLGKNSYLKSALGAAKNDTATVKEAMEGAASGFGHTVPQVHFTEDKTAALEGEHGRFKAVYITYWLNRLQNLKTDKNIFVTLNPHQRPDELLTHKRVIMAHPQFNPQTLQARKELLSNHQGANGLWFCGAWVGYGFHEDGCRSGFEVATKLSKVPLPWAQTNGKATTNGTKEKSTAMVLSPPDFSKTNHRSGGAIVQWMHKVHHKLSYDLPIAICKRFIYYFLNQAIQKGTLHLKFNDGSIKSFGNPAAPCGSDSSPVTLRVYDPWFFVKTAIEYDLGLARSYMAGHFVVEKLEEKSDYHPVIRPPQSREETNLVIGDPIGLTRLFLLLIGNRDASFQPKKSARGHTYAGALSNASGLVIGKIGSFINYLRYKITMDNSERGGSLKNIHAHYDISNDLFKTFLDKETMMYSCAVYDAIKAPSPHSGLVFRGSLEEAQWRKLDTLLERAQIEPGQTVLDIGFGWGGLSLHAAKKYGCKVTGITLSKEQKALAEKRVREAGVESLITFEIIDYRTFARRKENQGRFDRILSCEMIEAVGHKHLGEFFWSVERLLSRDGVLVMEAITTPEERYETYLRSTDLINTIIFPGSCCPSLHALVDAAYKQSSLTLEHIDNIGLHYAQTLAEWRRRFNASEAVVRSMGFDDVFLRAWNYYLTYCEAGFFSQTINCLILVFSRPGCKALVPLSETRSVTQAKPFSETEKMSWVADGLI